MTATVRRDPVAEVYAMPLGQIFTFAGYDHDLIKVNPEFYLSYHERSSSSRRPAPALLAISIIHPLAVVELRGKVQIVTNRDDVESGDEVQDGALYELASEELEDLL